MTKISGFDIQLLVQSLFQFIAVFITIFIIVKIVSFFSLLKEVKKKESKLLALQIAKNEAKKADNTEENKLL